MQLLWKNSWVKSNTINQFMSGILYFFAVPRAGLFSVKISINNFNVNETKSGQQNKHLFFTNFADYSISFPIGPATPWLRCVASTYYGSKSGPKTSEMLTWITKNCPSLEDVIRSYVIKSIFVLLLYNGVWSVDCGLWIVYAALTNC